MLMRKYSGKMEEWVMLGLLITSGENSFSLQETLLKDVLKRGWLVNIFRDERILIHALWEDVLKR